MTYKRVLTPWFGVPAEVRLWKRILDMKALILLVGLTAVLALTGCEETHEHGHRGGDWDDYNRGYGHGYSNPSRDYNYYPNQPYQGYPNDGYYHR